MKGQSSNTKLPLLEIVIIFWGLWMHGCFLFVGDMLIRGDHRWKTFCWRQGIWMQITLNGQKGWAKETLFIGIKCCFLSMADDFATFEEKDYF